MTEAYQKIEAKLVSLRREKQWTTALVRLGHGVLAWGVVFALLLICSHSPEALLIFQAALTLISGLGLVWVLTAFFSKPSLSALALDVEGVFPDLKNMLVNAVQLGARTENLEGYSGELIQAAIAQAEAVSQEVDFGAVVPKRPRMRALAEIGIGVLAVIVLSLVLPYLRTQAFSQFLNANALSQAESLAFLKVEPGNGKVAKGQSFGIRITVKGKTVREASVHHRSEGGAWDEEKAIPLASNRFEHAIESVMEPFEYYVTAGGLVSEHYHVGVSVNPVVAEFKLKAIYPAYSKVPAQEMPEGVGDVTALVGTVVEVSGKANVPLSSAQLRMNDSTQAALKPEGSQFAGKFVVRKDATYRFEIKDSSGESNEDPPEYHITAIPDEPPTVQIAEPGKDIYLPEDMTVPLRLLAHDDFGLTRMALKVKKGSGKEEKSVAITDLKGRVADTSLAYNWDLSDLGLLAGEEAVYYAEVYDNDAVSGPKRGVSQTYRVRFPSVEEMYAQSQKEQEEAMADLQGSLPAQEELKKEVERIGQELKAHPETSKGLTWEKKQEIQESLKKQEELLNQLEKTSQGLQQAADKAEQSPLVDMETVQKLQEVQRLMSEVMTEEMRKALEKLQEAMQKADPNMVQEAMKNLSLTQEELKQRLDKTIALLKDVQLEQKLKEAANKAQDLLTRQQALKEATRQSDKKELPALAPKQKELKDEAEQLAQDLKSVSDSLKATHPQVADSLAQFSQEAQGDSLSGAMEEAANQMSSQNPQGANKDQEKAERSLQKLSQGIKSAQSQKVGQDKKALAEKMRNAMKDLVYLSEKQNELNQQMGNAASNPAADKDALAKEQQDLQAGAKKVADQLAEAGQKTMFLTPEIMRQMGGSMSKMGQAQNQLEKGNAGGAKQSGQDAQAGLNQTVMSLMDAMGRMQASSSASGLQEALEQMAGLSQQQEGVNQGTQGLMPIPGESSMLSMQQRAEMARLAAEQGAIAKGMRDVQRSLEGSGESGLQGRTDEIAKDMEKVAEDLKNRKVDRQTIERQQQILTRLLDAQRSVRERDLTERRKSEPAKPYAVTPPKPLPSDLGDQQKKVREALIRAMKEGYPAEYEELIRAYFKALAQ